MQTCRVERKRYATPDALDATDIFDATPDALNATDKLVVWNRGDTQVRMLWRRLTNLSCATEESRNSGCFGRDRQICRVERTRYVTPDALEATDKLVVWNRGDT
jgi:hypothetical protein